MTVTEITEISKTRSKIFIDQEFAFVLYKGELRLYHIREDEEISEENYHIIMQEVLPKRARLRCMNLLKSRDYTKEQLRQKLCKGGYPEAVMEDAINYVESFHYIDDLRYATDYIICHECSKSRRRLQQDLQAKGISRDTIEQAFAQWQEQGGSQDEIGMICNLLKKKHYDPEKSDYKECQKLFAFLMRRGYSAEQIKKAMKIDWDWD